MNAASMRQGPTPQEIKSYIGRKVRLELSPGSPLGEELAGTLVGTIDAADGLVAMLEPEGRPGTRISCHYHYIGSIVPL